jgi:hypothetical protein
MGLESVTGNRRHEPVAIRRRMNSFLPYLQRALDVAAILGSAEKSDSETFSKVAVRFLRLGSIAVWRQNGEHDCDHKEKGASYEFWRYARN